MRTEKERELTHRFPVTVPGATAAAVRREDLGGASWERKGFKCVFSQDRTGVV